MKKIISIFVISILLMTSTVSTGAEQVESTQIALGNESYHINQSKSIETYFAVKETLISKNDTYGGCYIDDNGNLNIWYTDNIKEYKNVLGNCVKESQSIVYRKADYTYSKLESISNKLCDSMKELGIEVISIDEFNNRIQVVMDSTKCDKRAVIECVGNEDILIFDYMVSKPVDDAIVIQNGSAVSTTTSMFSIAVGAVRNGKYGFITAGHCNNANTSVESVYYNGSLMGTFRARIYGPNVDVAFIERSSIGNYEATNLFTDGTGYTKGSLDYVSGGFPAGTSVTKYGMTTGKTTGKIKSTNVSYKINGTQFRKLVSATYLADSGDSGGAIKVDVDASGLRYTYCAGIHKGRYTTIFGNEYSTYSDMTLAKEALDFRGYYD